jgi:hypothetical protein
MAQQFVRLNSVRGYLNLSLTLFVLISVALLLLLAVSRWLAVAMGVVPSRKEEVT